MVVALAAALAALLPLGPFMPFTEGKAEGQSRIGEGKKKGSGQSPAASTGQAPSPAAPTGQAPSPAASSGQAPSPAASSGQASAAPPDTEVTPRPGRVKLVYVLGTGTQGCDDEAFFRRMVASELEVADPFVPAGPATHELEVRIQKDAPGFRAAVKLRDAAGKEVYYRDFLERTCADAVDRAVIVSMLTVFPPVRMATGPPAPPPPPAPTVDLASGLERRVAELLAREKVQDEKLSSLEARLSALEDVGTGKKKKEKQKTMDITFALSAGALLTAGLTPDVGPGVWLGGEGSSGPISIGVEARAVLPWRVRIGPRDFDFSQYVGLLVPCGRYKYFFGCAVAGGGVDLSYSSDPSLYKSSIFVPILQFGGRLGAEIPFGDSIVGARAWGEVLYTTPPSTVYYYAEEGEWDRPQVSAFFGLGLVVKLN